MKLTVFGASGPIGQHLVSQAVDRGHEVTAVVRSTAPESRFSTSVTVVEADVYNNKNIEAALEDTAVVCNVLRHAKPTPADYRTVSGRHILDAMESAGVDRYLTAVPATVQQAGEECGLIESLAVSMLRLLRPVVSADVDDYVDDVTSRDLDWTVVRVLRLDEGPTTRRYKTGSRKLSLGRVSYGDLSAFMLDCCERGIYPRTLPKIRT